MVKSKFMMFVVSIALVAASGQAGSGVEAGYPVKLISASAKHSVRLSSDNHVGAIIPVPEPGNWAMLLVGALVAGVIARRRMAL